jgi:hypothetical protein
MKCLSIKSSTETPKLVWKYQRIIFKVSMGRRTVELTVIRSLIIWIPTFTGKIDSIFKMNMLITHNQKTNRTSWITFIDRARKWRN